MNAALLLEHYERIAEAPDAIARLRRFILDLAVRGKLVEQDPHDEPASELLKRITAEKNSLTNSGKIRRSKAVSINGEPPFDLPNGWKWAACGELGLTQTGSTPPKNQPELYGAHIPFIHPGDIYNNHVDYSADGLSELGVAHTGRFAEAGSVLMVCIGTIGKCQTVNRPVSFNQQINALTPLAGLSHRFVFLAMRSEYFQRAAWNASARTTIAILNKGNWETLPIPLPPLPEQHRIVAKVDELMALCDQLEAARAKREMDRDKLTLSTLSKLNEPDPETFADDARFALEHIEPLTKRTGQIKQLRHTILNLAVRGKLVEQDPNDEPASELLKRIDNAKQKIRGSGKRELEADGAPSEVVPFGIPLNWVWCGATYPAQSISDAGHKIQTKDVLASGKHPVVDQGKVFIRGYCNDDDKLVRVRKSVIVFGDHTRETKLIDFDFIVGADGVKILEPIEISAQFYHLCLTWLPLDSRGYGRHFKLLRQSHIPLPPLAEQHRIVAKVDELMALCDQLETSLVEGEQVRSKLLEAVLHEALEPA